MAISNSMKLPARAGRVGFSFDSPEFQATKFAAVWMTDDDHGPMAVCIELPPDILSAAHHHESEYVLVVLAGSIRAGRKWYQAGQIYVQDRETVYGPTLVGPEGLRAVLFFADRQGLPDQFAKAADRAMYGEAMVQLKRFAKREIDFPGFGGELDDEPLVKA